MMIVILKRYAAYLFIVSLIYLFEHLWEWRIGQSSSRELLAFLTLLAGAGATFAYSYAKYSIDENNDGKSDIMKCEGERNGR